jgi:hypothetical protein
MNFSALEKTWRKQVVVGGGEPAELVAARLKREVASAQRRIRGGIVLAAFVLFLGWIVTIATHITSIKSLTSVALLAHAVNAILFVLFFARALRSARAVRSEIKMMGGTLRESLSATLRTVELQMENARIAGYAIPTVVAIHTGLFVAKYLARDLPGFGVAVSGLSMAVFGAVIGSAVWHRYRTHLAPRREELREILRALRSETENPAAPHE